MMPLRQEVQFLRARAQRLREMADERYTALSDRLRMIAAEMDTLADHMQQANEQLNKLPDQD